MVVKHAENIEPVHRRFESSVIAYGSQTLGFVFGIHIAFESSVISYGSQTALIAEEAAS